MVIVYLLNNICKVGGISTVSLQKFDYLIQQFSYSVVVVVKNHPVDYEELYEGRLKIVNIGLSYNGLSFLSKFRYVLLFIVAVKNVKRKYLPDLVVTTATSIDFFLLPLIFLKIPLVLEIHATSNIIKQKSHRVKLFFYRLYSKIVLLNESELKQYEFKNSLVIPNFIENAHSITNYNKKNIVISGGRIDPIKQWDHQILAWNQIFDQLPDWEYHMYIDGELAELDYYRSLVDVNCNSFKVFPASNHFKERIAEASIMVLTSKVECFPMNILESFSAETVVISYSCQSGPGSLINSSKNGILIPQDDIDCLARSIRELAENAHMREMLAKEAKKNSEIFSPEVVMDEWNRLFTDLINENS